MAAERTRLRDRDQRNPYETALDQALSDLAEALGEAEKDREMALIAEQKADALGHLAGTLMDLVPEARRAEYARRLSGIRPISPTQMRGSPVFDNVIRLFKEVPRRDWSVSDVREELERRAGPVDGKALHNVLYYLARRGDLRRVGRGVYRIVSLG